MEEVLDLKDTYPGEIITPGRTDKKVVRGQEREPNKEYRNHVGTLNWLSMGMQYDIVYDKRTFSRPKRTHQQKWQPTFLEEHCCT